MPVPSVYFVNHRKANLYKMLNNQNILKNFIVFPFFAGPYIDRHFREGENLKAICIRYPIELGMTYYEREELFKKCQIKF